MHGRGFRNNKIGSTLIFLSFILVSMVGAAIAFSVNARETAEESYQRVMTDIACRSVLSEYDIRLYEDYGIIAFRGSEEYVNDRIRFYLDYTEERSRTIFSLDTDNVQADLKGFEIADVNLFEQQIMDAAKYKILDLDSYIPDGADGELNSSVILPGAAKEFDRKSLPSYGYSDSGLNVGIDGLTADGLPGLISGSGKTFMVNKYAFSFFNRYGVNHTENQTHFQYEVEYVIAGKGTDAENLSKVKQYFVTLRTPVNIAKIYADPVRSAKALAEAEALTPGPAATATQLVIITAWAIEDANEEWKDVLAGKAVDGLFYKDYLSIFLTLEDREIKLLRMMDLIQINLRETYYDSFLFKEHYCGFALDITLDGRRNTYEHRY